ncbi:MAG: NERD domain-containing protein [Psychrobium sp.]|nr:NERD domain-containing protein [Psychrobium sp.]
MGINLFTVFFEAAMHFWFIGVLVLLTWLLRLPCIKGMLGEWRVNRALSGELSQDTYQLFKNVTLPTKDGPTQIDHILLSPFGIFVVETKNMKGWIFGNERQSRWTQKIYRHKSSFQNPLRQNYKHTQTLCQLLDLDKEVVHSVIIFVGSATLKTAMPDNVGHLRQGLDYIRSKQTVLFSPEQVVQFAAILTSNKLSAGLGTHLNHVQHVKEIVSERENGKTSCPRCNSVLVERKNRKTGELFIGCSAFPKCRYLNNEY